MNTKKILVSFFAIAIALFAIVTVSAGEITNNTVLEIDGIQISTLETPNYVSVVAGEIITVDVYFTSLVDDSDVTIELDLEGDKVDTSAQSEVFDVEAGMKYHKKLKIEVPFELKEQVSDLVYLSVKIDGRDHKTEINDLPLRVQRPSYDAVIKSLTTPNTINAGDVLPIDFVLKNMGYNDLDDLYVEVSIPELGTSQGPMWVGDLVNLQNCSEDCDLEDTVAGRISLNIPYGTEAGTYDLKFSVYNEDFESSVTKQIVISNDLPNEVVVVDTEKTISVGQDAIFSILLVNPTNNVKVYRIVTENTNGLSVTSDPQLVAVPAGSSKTVTISASGQEKGDYDFSVSVFAGETLVDTVDFNVQIEGKTANTTVILTIILAIIFLVLLVVLIVLIGRKPEKTEDFGESYY